VSAVRSARGSGRAGGFTLLELLVTITVFGILTAIAVPSYTRFVASQKVRAASSDLYLSLVRARSEALKRSASVTLQPAASGWQGGWTIPDPNSHSSSGLIETHGAVSGVSITGPTTVVYQSSGRTGAATSCSATPPIGCFVVASSTWSGATACVSVDLSGRPYSAIGVSTC